MHICPECGHEFEKQTEEICPKCGHNFNNELTCPMKVSLRCIADGKKCQITGLNFEDCAVFKHKNGLEKI